MKGQKCPHASNNKGGQPPPNTRQKGVNTTPLMSAIFLHSREGKNAPLPAQKGCNTAPLISLDKCTVTSLAKLVDGSHILTGSLDKSAKFLDSRTLELIKLYVTERPVNAVAMSPLLDHVICLFLSIFPFLCYFILLTVLIKRFLESLCWSSKFHTSLHIFPP
ncbi:Eukaryotic translation initiation factor 3 subunit I [Melia azedarach]|uniref:Eukaryotic translation initiation factor 3 subunit I n=1 Tax=Melia azedarach TaxID=155640 RepID=A0ACC1XG03_MELAZ|nr:Eukaryotic translation initiation factor 3 subunit I [Melia azedarach]